MSIGIGTRKCHDHVSFTDRTHTFLCRWIDDLGNVIKYLKRVVMLWYVELQLPTGKFVDRDSQHGSMPAISRVKSPACSSSQPPGHTRLTVSLEDQVSSILSTHVFCDVTWVWWFPSAMRLSVCPHWWHRMWSSTDSQRCPQWCQDYCRDGFVSEVNLYKLT